MKYLSLKCSAVAAAICVVAAVPAMAQSATTTFQNGQFDQGAGGLNHWQAFGDVLVLGPRKVSVGTTASLDFEDDPPLPPGFRNLSGTPAVDFIATPDLAGIPVTSLDIGGFATEGSAVRQDFLATGGGVVTVAFDWTFLTTEPSLADGGMPDFGFVALNGTVQRFVTTGAPIATGRLQHTFVDAAHLLPFFAGSTLYTPRAGGQVSLVFGAVDIGDYLRTSDLRIDSVSVSAVPEPEAFAMLAAGLGLIGWQLRRRQKAQGGRTVA